MNAGRPRPPWPPLIVVSKLPRWVRWRDAILTLLMWALFAFMLEVEFKLLFGPRLERLKFSLFDSDANLLQFSGRLIPYLQTSLVLIALLLVAGVFFVRRRRRALALPQPAPLALTDQAERAGVDEATLLAARTLRIAIVHIEIDGRLSVESRSTAKPATTNG